MKKIILGLLLHFAVIPAYAQWQPGGIPVHNHTGPDDGGQLSNLNVLGSITTPEINVETFTATDINGSTITLASATIQNLSVQNNLTVQGNNDLSGQVSALGIINSGSNSGPLGGASNKPTLFLSGGHYQNSYIQTYDPANPFLADPIIFEGFGGYAVSSFDFVTQNGVLIGPATVTNPAAMLDVENPGPNAFTVNGSTFVVSNGNVGIGTNAPSQTLEVQSPINSTSIETSSGIVLNAGCITIGGIKQCSGIPPSPITLEISSTTTTTANEANPVCPSGTYLITCQTTGGNNTIALDRVGPLSGTSTTECDCLWAGSLAAGLTCIAICGNVIPF